MRTCDFTLEECRAPEQCLQACAKALNAGAYMQVDHLALAIRAEFNGSMAAMRQFEDWLSCRCAGLSQCVPAEWAWQALRNIRRAYRATR